MRFEQLALCVLSTLSTVVVVPLAASEIIAVAPASLVGSDLRVLASLEAASRRIAKSVGRRGANLLIVEIGSSNIDKTPELLDAWAGIIRESGGDRIEILGEVFGIPSSSDLVGQLRAIISAERLAFIPSRKQRIVFRVGSVISLGPTLTPVSNLAVETELLHEGTNFVDQWDALVGKLDLSPQDLVSLRNQAGLDGPAALRDETSSNASKATLPSSDSDLEDDLPSWEHRDVAPALTVDTQVFDDRVSEVRVQQIPVQRADTYVHVAAPVPPPIGRRARPMQQPGVGGTQIVGVISIRR